MGLQFSRGSAAPYEIRPRTRSSWALLTGASLIALGCAVSPALAQEQASSRPMTSFTLPPSAKALLAQDQLFGDWGGLRTLLADKGITFNITQTMDILGNLNGGTRQGGAYDAAFEPEMTIDLDTFMGWKGGTFYAAGYVIQGHGLSTYYLDNILTITSIEADPQVRLGEIWLQQSLFDGKLKLKVGQILGDQNFTISDTAGLFINSTFGWPGSFAVDQPGGGPAYPMATPGVQIIIQPDDAWLFQAAIFNGNPTGNGKNENGLAFPIGNGYFAIAELAYTYTPEGAQEFQSSTYKFGAYYDSEEFDNLNISENGWPLGTPKASSDPMKEKGNYAIYGIIDQALWTEPGTTDQGLRGFSRFTFGPQQNRNQVNWYFDVGLAYTGPLPGRDQDVFGVAFAYANISPSLAKNARINNLLSNAHDPVPNYEAALEITYQAAVAPWLSVQPFFQYIFHPGGNIANPLKPNSTIPDAAVVGTRVAMTF